MMAGGSSPVGPGLPASLLLFTLPFMTAQKPHTVARAANTVVNVGPVSDSKAQLT